MNASDPNQLLLNHGKTKETYFFDKFKKIRARWSKNERFSSLQLGQLTKRANLNKKSQRDVEIELEEKEWKRKEKYLHALSG